MSDLFFTADEHYGHDNIITFCKRPFTGRRDMIEGLIARHNAKVHRGAVTYHTGDMFWRTLTEGECIDIINRLNGQHAFLWGNHDERIEDSPALQSKFVFVRHVAQIDTKVAGVKQKIWLSHYAHRVWPSSHKGSWHVYGHTHAVLDEGCNLSHDVGVDANDYAPVSVEELAALMKRYKDGGAEDPAAENMRKNKWNKTDQEVTRESIP